MKIKAKLLLLDNQDSFTYNIVDLLRAFVQIETHVVDSNSFEVSTLDEYQYVIISPGPGKPNDFPVIPKVIAYCETNRIPLLGICLGHQAICEFFGAQLFRLKNVLHGQQHWIEIEPQSDLFLDVPNRIKVGLYHSWAIYKDSLPKELKATAVTDDAILMSVQHIDLPIYGIQFHPESFLTPFGKKIIANFLS